MNNKAVLIGLSVLAFLIALLLVIAIVRLLLGGRLRMPGGRTRQARLGIVDAFDLDRQRQLIIVRRDNTEHLIMIGGPNDLLIESEIVRIEARDVRPRDKTPDAAPGFGDRIPAPFALVDRPEVGPPETPRADEPLLPMPLPKLPAETTSGPPAPPEPVRTPTFPLPPRRPVVPPMPAPAPDRRPVSPPRLPESVLRDDGPPPPPPPSPPVATDPQPAPAPVPPVKQSFLKPLPPRPPIRPLKRVTPQGPEIAPQDPALTPPPPAPPPKAPEPEPKPVAPKAADTGDALDSLEEEMAKLLGRGPGS